MAMNASLAGIISLGPWGGSGGDHWSFKASSGISEITLYVDSNVKSISFTDGNGDTSGTFGGENHNDLGEEKKIKIASPSEYFTTISGTYGKYAGLTVITSLTFATNLTSYGPYGKTTGDEFSIPIADSVVVGFHGRSGYYLDALGIYVQPVAGSISLGPWGGEGGEAFDFKVASWIKEITIYDGQCINAIAFKDANGNEYGMFGGRDPKDAGTKKIITIDGSSEYLTSISGTYGTHKVKTPVITSLSFVTNLTTYGPFGTVKGTSFSIPIEGSFVNGFHGRHGYYLDAIGIFVKPKAVI
ncbi:mannose/glucose-specific lectin-like [Neltuma alba]|uniref:mannose/glucose-specific lectin-like n=1 Tax=Neltuma alba TaxID=207710 RepID=UPI0010A56C3A|nr:mannose/glucose-specific lectin-like [Prosopis alba]